MKKNIFLEGLIFFLPVFLSVYIFIVLVNIIIKFLSFLIIFIPKEYIENYFYKIVLELIAVVISIILITFVGYILNTIIGKFIKKIIKNVIDKIPLINTIYSSVNKFFSIIFAKNSKLFINPVIISYPHSRKKSIGFLTGKVPDDISPNKNYNYYTVYIPTIPFPTTGFTFVVREDKIEKTTLTSEEALKIIFSGGILSGNEEIKHE